MAVTNCVWDNGEEPMIEEARSQLPVIDNHLKLFVLNSSRTFGEQVSLQLAVEPSMHEGT